MNEYHLDVSPVTILILILFLFVLDFNEGRGDSPFCVRSIVTLFHAFSWFSDILTTLQSPFFSFDREEQPLNLNNGKFAVYNPLCTVSIIRRLATRPVK